MMAYQEKFGTSHHPRHHRPRRHPLPQQSARLWNDESTTELQKLVDSRDMPACELDQLNDKKK